MNIPCRGTIFISKVKRDSRAYDLLVKACDLAMQEGRAFMVQDVYCDTIGSATEFSIEQPSSQQPEDPCLDPEN